MTWWNLLKRRTDRAQHGDGILESLEECGTEGEGVAGLLGGGGRVEVSLLCLYRSLCLAVAHDVVMFLAGPV